MYYLCMWVVVCGINSLLLQENAVLTDEGDGDGDADNDGEADASCEECEVTDECAMLLNPTAGITPNTLRKVLKTPSHKYGTTDTSTIRRIFFECLLIYLS